MFKKKAGKQQSSRIESLIGDTSLIEGTLSFSRGLRIDGRVKGNVLQVGDEPSTLMLSDRGRIEGEVHVSHAIINGTVIGPVHGSEYVELQPKARVTGDVYYRTVEIHPGAVIQGRLVHQDDTQESNVIPLVQSVGD
jgi:cytoskeletal protein CcmA (bactofilin family)